MVTIADLRAACATGAVLDLDQFHVNRYRITAVQPCGGDCRNRRDGLTCAGVVDLALVGSALPVDSYHVADTYELPIAADTLSVAA